MTEKCEFSEFSSASWAFFAKKLAERGIKTPSGIQRQVIPEIESGKSVMFQAPTGSGKTFAYLLPLVYRFLEAEKAIGGYPWLLILSPTVELAAQIKREADFIAPGHTVLVSGGGNMARQARAIKEEKPKIVVGNCGRLLRLQDTGKLHLRNADAVVLDEADRLVSKEMAAETEHVIKQLLNKDKRMTIALSATLPDSEKTRLFAYFPPDFSLIETKNNEVLRDFIRHEAIWSEERRYTQTLRSFLSAKQPKKALVFASRAENASKIASALQYHKYKAASLWSGQEKRARKDSLAAFREGKISVLVTTDLAARGLDISGVTHVISLGGAPDAVTYTHRAGRTGRAGGKGVMVTISDEGGLRVLQRIERLLSLVVFPVDQFGERI